MFSLVELFGNLANAIYAVGSSFRNQIYLRLSMVIGGIFELYYDFHPKKDEPLWTMIFWGSIIIVINLYFVTRYAYEKLNLKLTDDEKILYKTIFRNMDVVNFNKFMKSAIWLTVEKDFIIINENVKSDKLFLLFEGVAEINVQGNAVSIIKNGNFVGEMSFLTGLLPTATVKTMTESRILVWDREVVAKMIKESSVFQTELNSIFSSDLIFKLVTQNLEKK